MDSMNCATGAHGRCKFAACQCRCHRSIMRIGFMLERHPIAAALGAGIALGLFVLFGTVALAVVVEACALVIIWRGNQCESGKL